MKKAIIYIFIGLFILTASYSVIIPHTALANCSMNPLTAVNFSLLDCAVEIGGTIVISIMGKVVWLAGMLLNSILQNN